MIGLDILDAERSLGIRRRGGAAAGREWGRRLQTGRKLSFDFAHGGEVLIKACAVRGAKIADQILTLFRHRGQNALTEGDAGVGTERSRIGIAEIRAKDARVELQR